MERARGFDERRAFEVHRHGSASVHCYELDYQELATVVVEKHAVVAVD